MCRILAGLILAASPAALWADDVQLTVTEAKPPSEVAESIRAELQNQVVRLADDEGLFFEFWFRKAVPLAHEPPSDRFLFETKTIEECTLLGALRVLRKRYDFKDLEIAPGVYTLRLGFQPKDGDHMGTAPTDFFALLLPAKQDSKLDGVKGHDDLAELSGEVNAAGHPSTLNLQPVIKPEGEFPRLAEHPADHKVIYLELSGKLKGKDKPVPLQFAIVHEGMGEI